ncbi:DUF6522 family protein [Microvirga sp. G4-2]|uniref:DUF6522 family protein n=1 Tax=Microvirga sp. G4-2 TaxID=3434467 RepID=UPI004044EAD8
MPEIEIQDGTIQVDASVLGEGLGVEPSCVPELLRSGAITSRCERGIGEDEGRFRLTFFHAGRRLRLVVEAAGRILQRSTIDFGDRPLPGALRRPGR